MVGKIKKLFEKITAKDRQRLDNLLEALRTGKTDGLRIEKLTQSDFFRVRSGRFRIIFHYEGWRVLVDHIRLRNEDTYKNL